MENLFRFALTRPPVEPGELFLPISLNQDSHFQNELRSVPITAPDGVRNKFKVIAERFITTSFYVDQLQSLKLYNVWIKIAKALDHLEKEADISNTMVMAAIETATGQSLVEIINSTDNTEHQKKLRDSIIAIKLLPAEHHRPLHKLTSFLRDMHLLEKVMQDSLFPESLQNFK